ncbi:hypothetical protein ACFL6E_05115 [Candidatus Neomarinimicrobiota bacterium]
MTKKNLFNDNLQFLHTSQKSMSLQIPGDTSRQITIDGPISEEYQSANPRILWVLKEPHGNGGGSLIEFLNGDFVLQSGKRYSKWASTYGTLIKVSHILLNPTMDTNRILSEYPYKNKGSLQKVALINLNKFGGGNRQSKHYYAGVEKCRNLVQRQILMLEPQIVICGSTFPDLANILEITIEKHTPVWPSRDCFPSLTQNGRTYISAYHTGQTVLTQNKFLENVTHALSHPVHV